MMPFMALFSVLGIGFAVVILNSSAARYQDFTGTVCCMADGYFSVGDREPALKMMTIHLDDGRSVDVPIRYKEHFVSYVPKKRVLVRQVKNKKGSHPRFMAVRYLSNENS